MANHGRAYGMSADLAKKQAQKYDPKLEEEARLWLEQLTNSKHSGSFADWLKDGQVLCQAMNALKAGSITKVNTNSMPFKQMENIDKFLKAAGQYGVPVTDLFQTVDLYEAKNMNGVIDGIHALGRAAQAQKFSGPVIGAKPSEKAERHFDQEVLNAGQAMIGGQAGFTGGATQKGMNFGQTRHM